MNNKLESAAFDANAWQRQCESIRSSCEQQAMTSLHFSLLLNQAIEDALRALPLDCVLDAIRIARRFEYETSFEVAELVDWFSGNAQCKHGVHWHRCQSSCEKACNTQQSPTSGAPTNVLFQ